MPTTDVVQTGLIAADLAGTVLNPASQRAAYLPFGYYAFARSAGSHLGYTGQLHEPGSAYPLGNGRRFYRPATMRFGQPDSVSPFGRGGLNAYAYCGAEPINRHDPSGQEMLDLLTTVMNGLGIVAYGAMMFTGYRLFPPSKLVVAVDSILMVGSTAALGISLATDSDTAKIASLAASTLTVLGRGALAAKWGWQGKAPRRGSLELTGFSATRDPIRAWPRPSDTPPARRPDY